jgi:hypothetical protein
MFDERQILERVQEQLDSEDGWKLIAEADTVRGWEGMALAASGAPVSECWHHVQKQAYLAWVADAKVYDMTDAQAMDGVLLALRYGVVEPITRLTDEQLYEIENERWGE